MDRDEAEKLGLIKPGEKISPGPLLKKYDFNFNLKASTLGIEPELLAKMKKVFGDRLKIEADAIYWTALQDVEKKKATEEAENNG